MLQQENLQEFYNRICTQVLPTIKNDKPHINVFGRGSCQHNGNFSRRDYYKATLILGKGTVAYADKVYTIDKPALLFSTPLVPYSWTPLDDRQDGWFIIFNSAFVKQRDPLLDDAPFFHMLGDRVFFINPAQVEHLSMLFRKMMEENQSAYPNKDDLLRNYLHLLVHEALKMSPAAGETDTKNAAHRITHLFQELLERQFPIDSQENQLQLRKAGEFADCLNVHVNHLNKAVKEVTGQTTSHHIASRIILEANNLMAYTDWTIAEIGYSLGFDYPAHFNNFYKKHTGNAPRSVRRII